MRIPTLIDERAVDTRFSDVTARARSRLAVLALPERIVPLAIVLVVVAVFAIGLRNEFVRWDDHTNLVDNPYFRGLGLRHLAWMFSTTLMGHYIPVTWLTFGLDYVIWGMQPAGYHFTNLVLHAANAVVFYWVANRLLVAARPEAREGALRVGAVVAALFFAIHPLRAESVAWATERRDVLSGLFFLTCVATYLRAVAAAGARRRGLLTVSVAAFVLAMLAKSIVMTLPLLLLVIDWYPLRRLRAPWWSRENGRILVEKLPFMIVGITGAAIAYWAVGHNEYFTPTTKYPLPSRIAMALYSIVFYVSKTVLPMDLSPLYELPSRVDPLDPQFLSAAVAVAVVSVALVALAGRWPAALAAYAWYVIVLGPVGGLVHAGFQLAHDRYSYLSCLPFAVIVGAAAVWLDGARASGTLRPPFFAASCAALGALLATLGILTWSQVQVWRDTESLWTHATYATPDCSICHDNYGALLVNSSPVPPRPQLIAIEHFQEALLLKPDRDKPYGGLGLALIQLSRPREAEAALRRALNIRPVELGALNNLGLALNQQQRFAEAEPYFRQAVAMDAHNVVTRTNLAEALVGLKRFDEALAQLHRAADEQPFAPEPRIGLVLAYRAAGKTTEMRKQLTILRQLHPAAARDVAAKHQL
jgi:tetratricopeptide (TPR) repeat protein